MNRRLHPILVLLVLAAAAAPAAAGDDWAPFAAAVGTWEGEAASGGEMVPVVTHLEAGPDGVLSGTYSYFQGGTVYRGTLRRARIEAARTLVVIWHDDWGYGTLQLVFDEDFGSFVGAWATLDDGSPTFPWVGIRKPAAP